MGERLPNRGCWCGNEYLEPFSGEYYLCPACQTLLWGGEPRQDAQNHFYGQDYFVERQASQGNPDIYTRARSDFLDRIPYWVKEILSFRQPPGAALEIGCSHGGLVSALRQVGFDASGIDLSPWVVDFARTTFNVPVKAAELSQAGVGEGTLDLVILMDVIEHVPDPLSFMRQCAELLKPGGVMVIQTPCLPAGKRFAELAQAQHPFLNMLLPEEHLFLYSRGALAGLLKAAGLPHASFRPAYFGQYDQFCFASNQAMNPLTAGQLEQYLLAHPQTRPVLALLDLSSRAAHLEELLQQAEASRQQQAEQLHAAQKQLRETQAQLLAHQVLSQRYQAVLDGLMKNRTYQMLRKLGRFSWFHQEYKKIKPIPGAGKKSSRAGQPLKKIVVDLTPILPGGANGGAKPLALELIRLLSREVAPQCQYVLFTSQVSHDELAVLDAENVTRLCVNNPQSEQKEIQRAAAARGFLRKLGRLAPRQVREKVARLYRRKVEVVSVTNLLKTLNADLVFCPFTAPFYYQEDIPIVILVHDIQSQYYPEFFTHEELFHLEKHLRQSCAVADRLVCISEFTRQTLLEKMQVYPDQLVTIHNSLINRIDPVEPEQARAHLEKYALNAGEYLFYPANYWAHKNHLMLLTAFNLYRRKNPQSRLKLALTGAPGGRRELLEQAVSQMGLGEWVVMPGFVSKDEFNALARGSRALIFPSLFEGFGMPVVEAMDCGIPVLCANCTSLPEIAGDAALYFDPRKPDDICRAIEELEADPRLGQVLTARGAARAKLFSDRHAWAQAYWKVFREAFGSGDVAK